MRNLFLSTVALVGLANAVAAADLPSRAAPPLVAAAPAFTWTGFYVGAHAGYLWSDSRMELSDVGVLVLPTDVAQGTLPRSLSVNHEAVHGGVQAGYNMQFGKLVAGVEADLSWTDAETHERYSRPDQFLFPGAMTNTEVKSELEWLGTVRGRLGLALDRALVYVTGGAAFGEVANTFSINIPTAPAPIGPYFSPTWTKNGTEWGWTIGAGIEFALTNNISIKAEYLYYDLGDHTVHGTDEPKFGQEFIDYKFKNDGNLVRAGLNFRY